MMVSPELLAIRTLYTGNPARIASTCTTSFFTENISSYLALSPRKRKKITCGNHSPNSNKKPETIKATYFYSQCAISCRHRLEVGMLHYQ